MTVQYVLSYTVSYIMLTISIAVNPALACAAPCQVKRLVSNVMLNVLRVRILMVLYRLRDSLSWRQSKFNFRASGECLCAA